MIMKNPPDILKDFHRVIRSRVAGQRREGFDGVQGALSEVTCLAGFGV